LNVMLTFLSMSQVVYDDLSGLPRYIG